MELKTNVISNGRGQQRKQTATDVLKVKSAVKAGSRTDGPGGSGSVNHNQAAGRGFKLKTNVRAGGVIWDG
jgi:hypothetical protein